MIDLKPLDRALKRLALTTGDLRPIARRNARRHVLGELRRIRKLVDEAAPAIVSRKGVKRLTGEGQVARLIRASWKRTDEVAGDYAAAGVTVKKIVKGKYAGSLWIPGWAAAIGPDRPGELRKAAKSFSYRRAILAREALLAGA